MASATIDTLQVKISASATDAAKALDSLANALKKVRNALGQTGKDGQNYGTKISRNLTDLHNAINKIDTDSVKKLNQLSSALNRYSAALGKLKGANLGAGAVKNIGKISQALDVPTKEDTDVSPGGKGSGTTEDITEKISLFDRLKDAASKVSEKFALLRERIKDFGKTTKQTSSVFDKFLHSIGRIALYRAIRSALKAIGEAFSEGLKNAYLWSKQSEDFTRLAEALDHLKSVTSQMINQIGAFAGEFKQFIMPAVNWIIEKVRYLAERLTELFAALNGQDTYQFAKLQALEWEEATEEAKKYKQQLLGIDELNNLTTQNNNGSKTPGIEDAFEVKKVSEQFKSIGTAWQGLKQKISDAFDGVYGALLEPAAMAVCGALFLFTGHPLLGIALILAGVKWGVEEVKKDEGLRDKLEEKFKPYKDLFTLGSYASIAVGAILLFVPGQRLLGLGLLLGGIAFNEFVKDPLNFSWGGLLKTIKDKFQKYKDMFSKIGKAAVAIGTMLLFVPGQRGLGLGLILAGTSVDALASKKEFSWGGLLKTITEKFKSYKDMFNHIGAAAVAIGAVLMFVPGMRGTGLGLILKGTGLLTLVNAENIQWDDLLGSLQTAWKNIHDWFVTTVESDVNKAISWLEDKLQIDINGDGGIGGYKTITRPDGTKRQTTGYGSSVIRGNDSGSSSPENNYLSLQGKLGYYAGTWVREQVTDFFEEAADYLSDLFTFKASGGIVNQGSLFYAGEAGPEFVGSMGGNTAVANTEQMTDAIYKAAYMGMTRALQENGGNGMNGFVPATTDDLFIAMRKKASNYNKMTGNSAFA